ncbi:MAG TPA: chaperonin GroEL [bacterium]|nr:chaperonin GroEL [bacterium]
MAKKLLYKANARNKILSGINKLSDAVKITLGPRGKHVVIERNFGSPLITKDGVTVANEIDLEDKFENIGAALIKEIASKTNEVAGDGTTTATVLAEAIYQEGLKNVTAGANPVMVQRGINKAVVLVVDELKKMAVSQTTLKEIAQVATIASNHDTEIGDMIARAMDEVGNDGVITVEDAKSMVTELKTIDGMEVESGLVSPYFVTDQEKMTVLLENPYILIYDGKIATLNELLPLLEIIAKQKRALLMIADDVSGEALTALVFNKLKGTIRVAAIKSPKFGDMRKNIMEDIAIATGAKYVSITAGYSLDDKENIASYLGTARKVTIGGESTLILEGAGTKEDVKQRVASLKKLLDEATSDYDRDALKERIAKFVGGVAVINVGAATETQMKEKKARVEDALHATRAAIEEGIIPGGGFALLKASDALADCLVGSDDIKIGIAIVKRALKAPLMQIAENTGQNAEVVVAEVNKTGLGYNAETNTYEDLIKTGIIDPVKVTRTALENAASIAALLLTTEVVIAESDEKKDDGEYTK